MRTSLWVLSIWLFTGGIAFAETVDFTLNPPLDKPMRLVTSRRTSVLGQDPSGGPGYSSTTKNEFRVVVTSEEGRRWFTSRLIQGVMTVNGKPVDAPLVPAARGQPVGTAFDDRGQRIMTKGLVDIWTNLAAAGDPLSLDGLRNRYARAWDSSWGTIWGALAGRSLEIGSSWDMDPELELLYLPSLGTIPVKGRWTVLGEETAASDSRVQVRYEAASDIVSLEGRTGGIQGWVAERVPGLAGQAWDSFTMSQQGELLIDPATLLEHTEWTYHLQVTLRAEDPAPTSLQIDITHERTVVD